MSRQLEVTLALLALLVAALLILVPLVLRRARMTRVRAWAGTELRHEDPARRAAAAVTLISYGLQRTGDLVLEFVSHEGSDAVLDQVAEAAAHHRWEPDTGPDAIAVRAWATARRRWISGELGNPPSGTVVVTGAGGPAGVNVIRELVRRGYRVHGLDVSPYAAGLGLATSSSLVPRSDEPDFPGRLLEQLRASGATLLISTLAEEMPTLEGLSGAFDDLGVSCWTPPAEAVLTCVDKLAFHDAAVRAGVLVPATAPLRPPAPGAVWRTPEDVGQELPAGPWVVKPRHGRGSRNVRFCVAAEELMYAATDAAPAIVQTRVMGREFTADTLVDRDGSVLACVPRWRLEVRQGISVTGETFTSVPVQQAVQGLVSAIGLQAVVNVQGIIDEDGRVWIIECNPRLSGGLPLTLGAGCDLLGQYLRLAQGMAVVPGSLAYRPGMVMTRWLDHSVRPA